MAEPLSYPAEVMADSPVGYWRLGELTGTSANDHSGNALTGTYIGGVTLGTSGPLPEMYPAPTLLGASSQRIEINHNALLDFGVSDPFTAEVWVKWSGVAPSANYAGLIQKGDFANSWGINMTTAGAVVAGVRADGATSYTVTSGALTAGAWKYLALVYDPSLTGQQVSLYSNAVLVGTQSTSGISGNITNTETLRIGRGAIASSVAYLDGVIGEAAVYDTALSATRIAAHYAAGISTTAGTAAGLSATALSEEPIGSSEVGSFAAGLDYWVIINGSIEPTVKIDSLSIDDSQGGSSSARFTLVNPVTVPRAGQSVQIVWQDETLFGGQLVSVPLEMDQSEAVKTYRCEASGWWRILERRQITASYASANVRTIFSDVMSTTLAEEGINYGTIDDGINLLLAKGENIRVAEFVRDVAQGSGGIAYVDPYQNLHFRTTSINRAPFILTEGDVLELSSEEDLDEYRNRQKVTVTGTSGASASVEREDAAQIAARIALEGGTGVYEAHQAIDHPTSNDAAELTRYGISYCLVKLAALARVRRTFKARIRRPYLKLGQIITVSMAGYAIDGDWQITRLRTYDEGGTLRFEFDAQLTNFQQLGLESLLRMVEAGRATIILPVANYANLNTITTLGASTWTVPGSGNVELQITVFGPGGGSQGPNQPNASSFGVPAAKAGFPGGRAITFKSVPAGTVLSLNIGAVGVGGASAQFEPVFLYAGDPGTTAEDTSVYQSGILLARGGGGGGGNSGDGPGDAYGDLMFPGDGAAGGLVQPYGSDYGASGNAGYIEIRY